MTPGKLETVIAALESGLPFPQEKVAELAESHDREVMELLLDLSRPETEIVDENVLTAAAANGPRGREVVKLLLGRGSKVKVTERVAMAAVGNTWTGKEVMEQLFRERTDEIKITQHLFSAANENRRQGEDIIELLLQ